MLTSSDTITTLKLTSCLFTSSLYFRLLTSCLSWVHILGKRKCVSCGAYLDDEDVMKIILEDGSCQVFPFSRCPKCFSKELIDSAHHKKGGNEDV